MAAKCGRQPIETAAAAAAAAAAIHRSGSLSRSGCELASSSSSMWLTRRRPESPCTWQVRRRFASTGRPPPALVVAAIIALLIVPQAVLANKLSKFEEEEAASATANEQQQQHSDKTLHLQRLPRRSRTSAQVPEFSAPIGNVTAVEGRDVRLVCTVEHLGPYQVAWLKEESKTILSIDTNIITTNYRIFLIPDEEERKWVLHIKDVQASDRGFYQCQVNTIPMRSTSGYLEVVVPPTIIEAQSSQVAELIEHSNVSLQCKADGHPRPSVTWRRDDGQPIKLNGRSSQVQSVDGSASELPIQQHQQQQQPLLDEVKSDKLSLFNVDRSMAGIYVCSASNGIPSNTVRRIPLYVKFPPKTSVPNKYVAVSLSDQLELDCLIEAFPKANSYWSKRSASQFQLQQQQQQLQLRGRAAQVRYGDRRAISPLAKQVPFPQPPGALASHHPQNNGSSSSSDDDLSLNEPVATTSSSLIASDTPVAIVAVAAESGAYLSQVTSTGATVQPRPKAHPLQAHATFGHPHNRIHFRQVDQSQLQLTMPESGDTVTDSDLPITSAKDYHNQAAVLHHQFNPSPSQHLASSQPGSQSGDTYVTVKQTAINSYTYKLRLTISRVQPDDFGEYVCIASSSMGTSESHVIVTKADKIGGERGAQLQVVSSDYRSAEENSLEFQQHSPADTRVTNQQHRKGQHVVYDENYLQAIKSRQSNLLGSSKSYQQQQQQQRLKFKAKNSASSGGSNLVGHVIVILICPKLLLFHLLCWILWRKAH